MRKTNIFLPITLLSALAGACGTSDSDSLRGEDPDYARILREAQDMDGKRDVNISCGGSTCEHLRCGDQCPEGARCERRCLAADSRPAAYVTYRVTGSESASGDSRTAEPYSSPVIRRSDLLIYGTDLWRFADGRQGFGIQYTDIKWMGLLAGDPHDILNDLEVYTRDFKGPGEYSADVRFSPKSVRTQKGGPAIKTFYSKEGGCQLSVSAADDGLSGTFNCTAATDAGGTVEISGEFLSGGTAIDGPLLTGKQH